MMKNRLFLMATALIALASCSNDEIASVETKSNDDAIKFRTLTTSRATETTITSLQGNGFYVTATDGSTDADNCVINNEKFTYQTAGDNSTYWTSDTEHYWPHHQLYFFAQGPSQKTLNTQVYPPKLSGAFSPDKDPIKQEDFVYATATGIRSNFSAGYVPMTFQHALSQIEIIAVNGSSKYDVYVQAVRLGYINSQGNFTFPDPSGTSTTTLWDSQSTPVSYTSGLLGERKLEAQSTSVLSNFMVVPQTMSKWFPDAPSGTSKDGAYLALLVKIVSKSDNSILYPVYSYTKTNLNDYDSTTKIPASYGWAAVPFEVSWEPGMKYTYTLDFTNGAGKVAPDKPTPDDNNYDTEKEPKEGDDIIGNLIRIKADIGSWGTGATGTYSMQGTGTN